MRRAGRLFACGLACFLAIADASERKPAIIYANVGGERVQRAFERLNAALAAQGVLRRYHVEVRHEVVDEHDPSRLQADMERIVAQRPAAIIAPGVVIATAARKATASAPIPVVFGTWENPAHIGLVESLARPGQNLTGSTDAMPLDEKRLELLLELAPGTSRIGVVVDSLWLRQPYAMASLKSAARSLGVALETFAVESESDLSAALESRRGRSMDAWYVPLIEVAFWSPDFVVAALGRSGKPVMYTRSLYVEKGGFAAYQSELGDVFEIWAKLLAQILAGVPPAIIPIERPRRFELAINLGTARQLGLAVPRPMLRRADRFY